jgi:hypothetical protein
MQVQLNEAVLSDGAEYPTVRHDQSADYAGIYAGSMIDYDWSGKYVLRQIPVTLKIDTTGSDLSIVWQEQGELPLNLRATNSDDGFKFEPAIRIDTTRYSQGRKCRAYKFVGAQLNVQNLGGQAYMSGNIQFFDMKERELWRPTYLDLRRVDKKEMAVVERKVKDTLIVSSEPVIQKEEIVTPKEFPQEKQSVVYPNPFTNLLNIAVEITSPGEAEITIHNVSGARVYIQKLGTLEVGSHLFTLPVNAPSGAYFVTVKVGKTASTSLVVKK